MMRQKSKKINQIMVIGGRRATILLNKQPKTCMHDGGGIIRDAQADGDHEGSAIASISERSSGVEVKK